MAKTTYESVASEDPGSISLGEYLISTLEDEATFFKDGSFDSEHEYRLVVGNIYSQYYLLHYRCNDWSMIPYLKVDIPNPDGLFLKHPPKTQVDQPNAWRAIVEVVIGPTADKSLTAEAVGSFFMTNGIKADIRTTNIPFRDW